MAHTSSSLRPYQRIARVLREQVRQGYWRTGAMLPGRQQLARQHGVALGTLERAVTMLISEGILRADDRRGTFVADGPVFGQAPATNAFPPIASQPEKRLMATIGILADIVPYDSSETRAGQWPAQILAGCEQGLARERGLTQRFVSLVPEMGKDIACAQAAKQLLEDGVDALVVLGCSDLTATLALTEAAGVPLVCAEYDPVTAAVPQVHVDNEASGALAARHLRERGYGQIVYLRPFRCVWTESRLAGARSALGDDAVRVFPVESALLSGPALLWSEQHTVGQEAGHAFLRDGFEAGTGVIAPNDAVAMGFMAAAREQGLEPGRDYGLVGFDDRCREAHLTSLCPPLAQLGREAADLVVRLLRGDEGPARVALRHQLIARESTAAWENGEG